MYKKDTYAQHMHLRQQKSAYAEELKGLGMNLFFVLNRNCL